MAQAEDDLTAAGEAYLAAVETTRSLIEAKLRAALVAAAGDADYLADVHTVTMTARDDPGATPRLTLTVQIETRVPALVRLTPR